MTTHAKVLLTVPEVLHTTGIGRTHLYTQIKSGALRVIKVGRCTRIHRADLEAWIESLREQGR